MTEWKEYKLGEIVSIASGFAYKGEHIGKGENLLLGMGCVSFKEKFLHSGARPYAGDCAERYYAKVGDIVLATRQQSDNLPILGMPAIIPEDLKDKKLIIGANLYRVTNNSDFDNKYIYWLLKTPDYVRYIASCKTGTTVAMITKSDIENFTFVAPDKSGRERILKIMDSLDDKIDLLHRENKTLEAMAETLFRQWFIEEAKEDWEEKPLSFYGKIVCGKTPPKKESKYFGGETPFIKIPDMHNKTFVINSEDSLTKEGVLYQKEKILPPFSIIVSCIATVGLVVLNAKEAQTNQQINSIIPYEEEYRYFLYLHLMNMYDDLNAMASGGTATLNLNTSNFSKIKIAYPTDDVLCAFNKQVSLLFDKIYNNQQQIQTLIQQRDSLLPKLMSGEVKI